VTLPQRRFSQLQQGIAAVSSRGWVRRRLTAIGLFCTFAVFWTLPTAWLSGTAAAGAIALINSIGNLAGFGGPYLIGWVKEATGNTSTGLLVLSVLPLAAGLLVFSAATRRRPNSRRELAGRAVWDVLDN
jgi:nitrate/nitrite transporter NarK